MDDKRATDRRKKKTSVTVDKRKGPRRLVCSCGGKIEVKLSQGKKETFECLRCGRKH